MIIIKNDSEIEYMRQAGKLVGETLLMLEEIIKPGITTAELDRLAEEFIKAQMLYHHLKDMVDFQHQYVHHKWRSYSWNTI